MPFSSSAPAGLPASVSYKGLAYAWHEEAFLSPSQAAYALERLWERAAGGLEADWEGPPALLFPALTRPQIEALLDLPPGALPWAGTADFLPAGAALPFEGDSLPALGSHDNQPYYDGCGGFPLDLPAAAFLLLTRWEDTFRPVWDNLGRPDETAALNFRQGFHERPVLDEWGLVLRAWLQKARPGWRAASGHGFRLWLTHDIDHPYCFKSWKHVFRRMARQSVRHKSLGRALKTPGEFFQAWRDFRNDPYYQNTLGLMDFDEQMGRRGTFFFMTAKKGYLDDGYDLSSSPYRDLLMAVQARGHETGWHPGFAAASDETVFAAELARANQFFGPGRYGARRHYLTWRGPQSWRALAAAGCLYDAGFGYTRRVGFRAATAHPFPAYDLQEDRWLDVLVRPLAVQDVGLMSETGFDFKAALMKYSLINKRVKAVCGELAVLTHNSYEPWISWMKKILFSEAHPVLEP
jgi:hypothetical protein